MKHGEWGAGIMLAVRNVRLLLAVGAVAALVGSVGHPAMGAGAEPKAKARAAEPPKRPPLPEAKRNGSLAQQYCASVQDRVAEARFAHQTAELEALAKKIDERLAKLDANSALLKEWVAKRESFMAKATQQLVGIFAAMRAEAASEQLTRIDPGTAAAILLRLDSRAASAILNDMPPEKAARLASIIADAANKTGAGGKP